MRTTRRLTGKESDSVMGLQVGANSRTTYLGWVHGMSVLACRNRWNGSGSWMRMAVDSLEPRVVVIGAGVGGMSVAGRVKAGYPDAKVTVLEKQSGPGGRMDEIVLCTDQGSWRFDLGPTLLLLPEIYQETFRAIRRAGSTDMLLDDVNLKRVDPNYKVFFYDEPDTLTLWSETSRMRDEIERIEKGAFPRYEEYIAGARTNYRVGWRNFIARDQLEDWISLPLAIPELVEMIMVGGNPLQSLDSRLRSFFKSPKLRAANSFQSLYVGLSPKSAPAIFSLLHGLEVETGVWYPAGGMKQIAEKLQCACQDVGVEFRYSSLVTTIDESEDGTRVRGVTLSTGESIEADIIVCNADWPFAEIHQLRKTPSRNFSYSSAVVSLLFALDRKLDGLAQHSIFISEDYDGSWRHLFESGMHLPRSGNFYVHAPARTDSSCCPPSCDSIMCLVPIGHLGEDLGAGPNEQVVADIVRRARDLVLAAFRKAGLGDVERFIVAEEHLSPVDWRDRFHLQCGSAFGIQHTLQQLSVLRPGPKDSRWTNLFRVGSSVRPGNGVPLVMTGAKHCARRILRTLGTGKTEFLSRG